MAEAVTNRRLRIYLYLLTASWGVAAAACGGSSAQPGSAPTGGGQAVHTCASAKASRHIAYLVVQHLSGQAIQRCVGFDGPAIDGETVMKESGIQYQSQLTSSGLVVCQIDHEPSQPPSACASTDQPHWWLWLDTGGAWNTPSVGYSQLQIHDREGIGWRYVLPSAASPSPPPLPRPA